MSSPQTGKAGDWDDDVGPAERALGLIADARNRGGVAAGELADRLIDPATAFSRNPSAGGWRDARRDAELALDVVVETLRDAMDRAEGFVEQARGGQQGVETMQVDALPGSPVQRTIWIHNVSSTPWSPIRIRLGELIDVDGEPFTGNVSFDPELLPPVPAHDSIACTMTLNAAHDSAPREFHGLVLVLGAAELQPLHLIVRVLDR